MPQGEGESSVWEGKSTSERPMGAKICPLRGQGALKFTSRPPAASSKILRSVYLYQ